MPKRMSNIKCQISNILRRVDIRHRRLDIGHYFSNQAGFGQLAVIALLIAGVAITTLVVQNRTNISPNAQEQESSCEETRKDNECRDDGYIYEIYQDCNGDYRRENTGEKCGENKESGESCQYDEKYEEYECKNGYRCWNDYYKSDQTNCKWESKDPHYHCDQDAKCSNDVKERSDNSEQDCKNAGGEWKENRCFLPSVSKGGPESPEGNPSATKGQYDQGDCRDGAQSYKDGYKWITYCSMSCASNQDCISLKNTKDPAVNPETSYWCYGFNGGQASRCMQLVQSDNSAVNDQKRKDDNAKAIESIKTSLAQGGNANPAANQEARQSSSVELRAKVDAQNKQRNDLIGEMATVINTSGGSNSTVNAEISRAQNLLTEAAAKATSCYTGTDKPLSDACDADAQAANDIAVAASRVALFDAVAIGVPDTCVKVDMAVGNNTTNSLIEVTPASGGTASRLFMCRGRESKIGAKDGVIIWQVRDDQGKLQNVSQTSLDKLNLKTGQTNPSSIPEDFINRRNNAAKLANQPAYNASSASSSQSTEWKEVAVSNCLSNCSSFPSGAVCYQKGTTNQYNCDGKKPTTTTQTAPTTKKDLPKGATCNDNKECKSGQCNPGTSKCI